MDYHVGRLTPGSYGADDLLLWLVTKIPKALWAECWSTEKRRTRVHTYADLALLLTELALDRQQEIHFEGIFKLANDSNPQRFTHKQNAQLKLIKNCSLFYCQGHDDNGEPIHAEDCTCQESCLLIKGKKQENHVTKDGQKEEMPDHFRCTVTCGFCGKRRHYEDECHKKKRISDKLKAENAGGKNGGKGESKGRGKGKGKGNNGQGQDQGGRGVAPRQHSDPSPQPSAPGNTGPEPKVSHTGA